MNEIKLVEVKDLDLILSEKLVNNTSKLLHIS